MKTKRIIAAITALTILGGAFPISTFSHNFITSANAATDVITLKSKNAPNELVQASRSITRRTNIDRYRSRTEVTTDHIYTAYTWLKLPVLTGDELQQTREWSMKYKTAPITRGIPEEEALENAKQDEALFKKQMEGIRKEYKDLEDQNNQQQALLQQQAQEEQYQQFSNVINEHID